ncbi:MAG: glycosyltransferase, partial [Nitrospirota bacterium]|nr:glycosyltransferase [Nitrospirota bacterium]
VVAQTKKPLRWVIVSDGSTDSTDQIVSRYAERYAWIDLVRLPERKTHDFGAKVRAFNAGYIRVQGLSYSAIGNLDADISFDPEYFSFLLSRLAQDQTLGVVGTPFLEKGRSYDYRFSCISHVSGAWQLFRRQCFEEVGGYVPTTVGGVDLVAVLTARMKGWQTRSFTEKTCVHHRNMGKGKYGRLLTAFHGGRGDFVLGGHPLWEVCRSAYQMTIPPYIFAGLFRLAGYTWAAATQARKQVGRDVITFRRAEQMARLRAFIGQRIPGMTKKAC